MYTRSEVEYCAFSDRHDNTRIRPLSESLSLLYRSTDDHHSSVNLLSKPLASPPRAFLELFSTLHTSLCHAISFFTHSVTLSHRLTEAHSTLTLSGPINLQHSHSDAGVWRIEVDEMSRWSTSAVPCCACSGCAVPC